MNESTMPGPAPGLCASPTTAVPISTKIPVPMIAPMPSMVRSQAVSVFFRRYSGRSLSARISSMDLVRSSGLDTHVLQQGEGILKKV